MNLYAPTQSEAKEQEQFIGKVDEALASIEIHTLLLGGDMNIQLDRHSTNQGRRSTNTESFINRIKSLMDDYTLEDVWKQGCSKRGTFHRGAYTARLDYWFIPAFLLPKATITITPHPLSDHCLLTLIISFAEFKRGPGYWRFDNSLLAEERFVEEMSNHIGEIKQEKLSNPNLDWE